MKMRELLKIGVDTEEVSMEADIDHNSVKKLCRTLKKRVASFGSIKKMVGESNRTTYILTPQQSVMVVFCLKNTERTLGVKADLVKEMYL